MYIVVTNKTSIPNAIEQRYNDTRRLSMIEFVTAATSDDGIDIDEGLLIDATCLKEDVYESLKSYEEFGVTIIYYANDKKSIPYYVDHNILVFSIEFRQADFEDDMVVLIYDGPDFTSRVYIDKQEYEKHKIEFVFLDYYEVIKMYAYNVHEEYVWSNF